MKSILSGRLLRGLLVMVACTGALVLAGVLRADDYEDPVPPPPGGLSASPTVVFGDLETGVEDVGGFAIDAKATIEPQVTATLIVGDTVDPAGDSDTE